MQTILVSGVETVIGANLAATLSDAYRVVGLSGFPDLVLAGCEIHYCDSDLPESARQWVSSVHPDRIIHCGAAARSTWQYNDRVVPTPSSVNAARSWARLAGECAARLTLISSDAVFTGPWMFHREESDGLCPSEPAALVRKIEENTGQLCPDALIVRTNAFGWAPDCHELGWIETALAALDDHTAGPYDYLRHSTPIHAGQLAEILDLAWHAGLEGEYHICGSERINPGRFIERLAQEFGLPAPHPPAHDDFGSLPSGFGRGECSLHTGKIRKALGIAMPTIADGLERLRRESENGYRDRLNAPALALQERAA